MEILESLHDRLPETGKLQRIVIVSPETGARYLSAVLVRIPAGHEFPLHKHPLSEDCFFALSGGGEAIEPRASVSISAPSGVWIPKGHPHGLRAGPAGMLELGVQAPSDPTAVACDPHAEALTTPGLLTQAFSPILDRRARRRNGSRFFPRDLVRDTWTRATPHSVHLDASSPRQEKTNC